jgi:hypothetical protein
MPNASTLYRHAHPKYANKEKEQTRVRIVNKHNNDHEYKELLKASALAYYYRKKQEKESKYTNDNDVEYY